MHIKMEEVENILKEKYHWNDSQLSGFTDDEKMEALKQLQSPVKVSIGPNETMEEDISEADAPSADLEHKQEKEITKDHKIHLLLRQNGSMVSGPEGSSTPGTPTATSTPTHNVSANTSPLKSSINGTVYRNG